MRVFTWSLSAVTGFYIYLFGVYEKEGNIGIQVKLVYTLRRTQSCLASVLCASCVVKEFGI